MTCRINLGKAISSPRSVKRELKLANNLLFNIGLILAVAGVALAVLAIFVTILRSARGRVEAHGGGVIMIGPVPIVFGTDKGSVRVLMLLGIVLMFALILFSLLPTLWR
jgi:uncharacterized protein (TIGR00304 family)